MKSMFIRLGLTALFLSGLAGCGGDSGTAAAPATTTPATPVSTTPTYAPAPAGANVISVDSMTPAQFASTTFQGQVGAVDVSSGKPVISFKITDGAGNPVTGLGHATLNPTNSTVPTLANLAFNFAKLVPNATGPGSPSRWVNLLVMDVPKLVAADTTDKTTGAVVKAGSVIPAIARRPNTEGQGTLVDNGDGTYKYTFYRDVTKVADIINNPQTLADTKMIADRGKKNASTAVDFKDLCGDPSAAVGAPNYGWSCAWEPTRVHRVGVFVIGNAPGTGTNTPDGCNAPQKMDATNTCVGSANTIAAVALKTPTNFFYDFVPATGQPAAAADQRNIVKVTACLECHYKITGIHGGSFLTGVGGTRQDTRMCVMCHTEQAKFGAQPSVMTATTVAEDLTKVTYLQSGTQKLDSDRAMVYFPAWIHRLHQGENLVKSTYSLGTVSPNAIRFPQDRRNCLKCHAGGTADETPQKDNWKNVPNRAACGACHDGINFADGSGIRQSDRAMATLNSSYAPLTGTGPAPVGTPANGHGGGAMVDDSACTICHKTGGVDIELVHRTTTSTSHNPTQIAGVSKIDYQIGTVSVNATTQQASITFKILKDGVAVTSFNTPTLVRNASTGRMEVASTFEPITGFAGGPSFYVAMGLPQDGITDPADFNASFNASLANLLVSSGSPKAGSITGPDATTGFFTATITGDTLGQPADAGCAKVTAPAVQACNPTAVAATPVSVPATAKLVTGAMIGTFTQKAVPTTLTPGRYTAYVAKNVAVNPNVNATGGVVIKSVLQKTLATGYKDRRVLVSRANCEGCHDQLGTDPEFHGGARNDPTACNICHNTVRSSSGYPAASEHHIHAIHGARKRAVPYLWNTVNLNDASKILYPGVLRNCKQCHLPNTVNFGGGTATSGGCTGTDNSCQSYAIANGNIQYETGATGTVTTSATQPISPWTVSGTNYGSTYGVTFGAAGAVTITEAAATNLMNSPIANACFACHNDNPAMAHMRTNGGFLYATRAQIGYNDGGTVQTATNRLNYTEGCPACHGVSKPFDAEVIHMSTVQ